MIRRTTLVLVSFILYLAPTWGLAGNGPAGVVAAIDGQAKAVQVTQGNETYTPGMGFLLYAGDRLVVDAPGTRVQVSLFDGRAPLEINKDNAAIQGVITAGQEPPTQLENLLHWLAKRLPRKEKTTTAMLAIRGDNELTLAATGPGEQQIVAGKRDWVVAWHGGDKPYGVRLLRLEDGRLSVVSQLSGLNETRVVLPGVAALPGQYRLEVTDKMQQTNFALIVVPESLCPGLPSEIATAAFPAEFKNLLYIAWLQAKPGWKFEAMQQAAQASRTDPNAARILRAMEAGTGDFFK